MKIQRTMLVMRQEIYATLRRAFFVIFAFVIPIGMGVVAIVTYAINDNAPETVEAETSQPANVIQGYVDPSGWIKVIPDDSPLYTFVEYGSEPEAQAALDSEKISGYFILPEDFLETGELVFVVQDFKLGEDRPSTYYFQRMLGMNLFESDLELGLLAVEPLMISIHEIAVNDGPLIQDNWLAEQLPFFLVILLYIVILVPASSLVNSITDEKKNRVIEILLSSVSAGEFFVGKLLALGLLGIVQTFVWVGVIWAVGKFGGQPLNLPADFAIPTQLLVWAVVFSFTGYAMYGTQMAGIGALAPDVKDTRSLTLLVLAPLLFGYTFNIIFLEVPNSTLAVVLSLFPLTAPVVMIGRMATTNIPVWQPILSLALQFISIIWIIKMFTRLFRAQALLSGQELNVRRFVQALRTP